MLRNRQVAIRSPDGKHRNRDPSSPLAGCSLVQPEGQVRSPRVSSETAQLRGSAHHNLSATDDPVERRRSTKKVALSFVAPFGAQQRKLSLRFNAFCQDGIRRLLPRASTARMMAFACGLDSISVMNDRSSLILSNGKSRSVSRDE